MMKRTLYLFTLLGLTVSVGYAQQDPVAPKTPALALEEASAAAPAKEAAPKKEAPAVKKAKKPADTKALTGKTAPGVKETLAAQADVSVEAVAAPVPEEPAPAKAAKEQPKQPAADKKVAQKAEKRIVFNPKNHRDPTLSPDDFLLIQYREQQRLAAIEAERQRKLAEERRKREEAERLRQLELARIKDPTREVRNKIRVGGIIGQEVFIGEKIYTVGKSIYGARIVEVHPDEVVFSYKGHKFVRKVQLEP